MSEEGSTDSGRRRASIQQNVKRRLLMQCGYRCAIPHCTTQWPALQFHHIDENPSRSTAENLLVLCASHHQLVTQGHIDRKSCTLLKSHIDQFELIGRLPHNENRNQLLYSLMAELHVSSSVLYGPELDPTRDSESGIILYPRLPRVVLQTAIAAGHFINDQDRRLFTLLFNWSQRSDEFNRRMDLTEARLILVGGNSEFVTWHEKIVNGPVLAIVRHTHLELMQYLFNEYGEMLGIDSSHQFFEAT